MKTTTSPLKYFMNRALCRFALLISLALVCFTFAPLAHATCQEGCLTNDNTVLGDDALVSNTDGFSNTAIGQHALSSNTTGSDNTATGATALNLNTTGGSDTAIGFGALANNTIGWGNTAIGWNALQFITTGHNNIALGLGAGIYTRGDGNIIIGNNGEVLDSQTIRIGSRNLHIATFIAGIRGVTTRRGDAIPVLIDSAGQLGTASSSRRFKKDIEPMDQSSEAILGLKPVTFHYKSDSEATLQFGLVAEEVAQVNPDLVARDEDGEIYTVRYDAVNAMLLNEFLKEHRTVQEQGATIARLEKQVEALTTGLQKVSAQLELSKAAPQTVSKNR